MRALNKKIVFVYGLIIAYVVARILSVVTGDFYISNEMNLGIWGILFLIGIFATRGSYNRYLDQYDKIQTTFIVVVAYLMVYFILGLFVGYQYNAYSMTPRGLIHNTNCYISRIYKTSFY